MVLGVHGAEQVKLLFLQCEVRGFLHSFFIDRFA